MDSQEAAIIVGIPQYTLCYSLMAFAKADSRRRLASLEVPLTQRSSRTAGLKLAFLGFFFAVAIACGALARMVALNSGFYIKASQSAAANSHYRRARTAENEDEGWDRPMSEILGGLIDQIPGMS